MGLVARPVGGKSRRLLGERFAEDREHRREQFGRVGEAQRLARRARGRCRSVGGDVRDVLQSAAGLALRARRRRERRTVDRPFVYKYRMSRENVKDERARNGGALRLDDPIGNAHEERGAQGLRALSVDLAGLRSRERVLRGRQHGRDRLVRRLQIQEGQRAGVRAGPFSGRGGSAGRRADLGDERGFPLLARAQARLARFPELGERREVKRQTRRFLDGLEVREQPGGELVRAGRHVGDPERLGGRGGDVGGGRSELPERVVGGDGRFGRGAGHRERIGDVLRGRDVKGPDRRAGGEFGVREGSAVAHRGGYGEVFGPDARAVAVVARDALAGGDVGDVGAERELHLRARGARGDEARPRDAVGGQSDLGGVRGELRVAFDAF